MQCMGGGSGGMVVVVVGIELRTLHMLDVCSAAPMLL